MSARYRMVTLPDGRRLEVLDEGEGDQVLVFFWGTPGAAVPDPRFADLAERFGLRILQPNRPGYGQSDPHPGRRIADLVPDVDAVLRELDIASVVVMGGSGGGPHALAMAARLPQCAAAAALVSPAPRDAADLDYYAGMALSNQEEWRLADQGEAAVRPFLEKTAAQLGSAAEAHDELFGDCLSPPDRLAYATVDPALQQARQAKGVERGIEGWLEDDIALTTPWGFDLGEITRPVSLWTGRQDRFISCQHSVWLAERVQHSDLHLLGGEGHVSVRHNHMHPILDDLLRKGASRAR